MSSNNAAAVYGLTIPANGEHMPASLLNFPVRIHISMAAIDPTAPPKPTWNGDIPPKPRATLKLIRVEVDSDDDEDDDEEDEEGDEYLKALINASDDDDEDSDGDSDDEPNGGPSDKSKAKSKKERRAQALAELIKAAQEDDDEDEDDEDGDEEMADAKPNGTKLVKKGKEKATGDDEEEEEESDDEDEDSEFPFGDAEEFVLCTLDTERTYQQPLNITINENEVVFFQVSGTHDITLTGNYIDTDDVDSEDDDDYDLDPDQEKMIFGEGSDGESDEDSDDESDELDDIDEPRVTEVDSEDDAEEPPQLVQAAAKKGKNKRPAEDEPEGLDEMIAKDEQKLSKKQLKKLKNNKGEAVASEEAKSAAKNGTKGDKKVQFAKELEQGPTGSASKDKDKASAKGVKVVQGVSIDDRTIGSGRTVKNGDTVGMRYIGKLKNGKQFDANKKGRPFYFKVGKGEVIKGWDVGIVGMQIGGERRLTIPPAMGYGSKGIGNDIPPNSTLVFDVKLLEIK